MIVCRLVRANMSHNTCIFAHLKDEKPKHKDEKMYTCVHGKVLSFETARKELGLKN